MGATTESLASVRTDWYASSSKSCQAKHEIVMKKIQKYLEEFQAGFDLPEINISDLDDTGGSFSTDDEQITKWWFAFWDRQPDFWFSLEKSNGESYGTATLERYMGSVKNQLMKKFSLSHYLKVIEEAYNSSLVKMRKMMQERKKTNPSGKKKMVYSNENISFILERCLWLNHSKFIDFFVFQTATLRLSSRAAETSRLSAQSLSVRDHLQGQILQCYLIRDKKGVDGNHPLIPNKEGLFGDPVAAIGLALFFNKDKLMPSISGLSQESAVSSHYTSILNTLWKRYPPPPGSNVRKGTSHFGKYTAQFQLDDNKLHMSAQCFGAWNVGEGARPVYFTHPFPYLLDGAKALGGWPKVGVEYQDVTVPSYDTVSNLGDRICEAFYGHIPTSVVCTQVKRMILVCVLAKWDNLRDVIRSEPNGLFLDESNHIIFSTLLNRLSMYEIEEDDFDKFKTSCFNAFTQENSRLVKSAISAVISAPAVSVPIAASAPSPSVLVQPHEDPQFHVHRLSNLLDLVSRNTSPESTMVNYFTCNYMAAYRATPAVPKPFQHKYRRIKISIRVMVRFLDNFPSEKLKEPEAAVAVSRIRNILLNNASLVKHNSAKPFSGSVTLSMIRMNEELLTDKSKPWYRKLPANTPYKFIEHMWCHKIYDIE